jgi:hypothetical protein
MNYSRANHFDPEPAQSASQCAEFGVHPLGCPRVSTSKWFWPGARFLVPVLALCLWAGCGKPAPKAAGAGKAATNPPPKTGPTNAVNAATTTNNPFLSVFVVPTNPPKDGRDPFFPVSSRSVEVSKPKSREKQKTAETGPEGVLDVFVTPTRPPTAIINHHTFFKGDVADIIIGNSRVPVSCIDVVNGMAEVMIDGHRRQLYSGRQLASFREKNLDLRAGLKLELISPPPNRMAMINGRTLGVGETATIRLLDGTNSVSLKCEEIRNDSVVVIIDGEQQEIRRTEAPR